MWKPSPRRFRWDGKVRWIVSKPKNRIVVGLELHEGNNEHPITLINTIYDEGSAELIPKNFTTGQEFTVHFKVNGQRYQLEFKRT